MNNCQVYPTSARRREKCINLGLCPLCAGRHDRDADCLAKRGQLKFNRNICNSYYHVTPLCDKEQAPKGSANAPKDGPHQGT